MSMPKHTHIASSTPSRTRIKLSQKRRNSNEITRIVTALKQNPQVLEIRVNDQTGSLVIHHAAHKGVLENIEAVLQDLGIILASTLEMPGVVGKSEMASHLTQAITDLNQQVGQTTNGVVDLRFLVPLGFSALAIRQLIRNGLQIEMAPWYVLAYYAFDSFLKLHYTQDPDQKRDK